MSKQNRNNTLKTPLYGNCRVQNPDGVHIFNCGEKKANWYLKRDLASVICLEPFTIQLKFIPNGHGHANDNFYLQKRQNICVSCGINEGLTKHHVVPYCYRKFFPEHLKNHTAYDILPLCSECHENYEIHAQQLKKQLADEYAIQHENAKVLDTELKNVCLAASALLNHSDSIPPERNAYLTAILIDYFNKDEITREDLEKAANLEYNTQRANYKPEGQAVVENISDISLFVQRWRKHFVDSLKPQYMPQHWIVERPL